MGGDHILPLPAPDLSNAASPGKDIATRIVGITGCIVTRATSEDAANTKPAPDNVVAALRKAEFEAREIYDDLADF